MVGKLPCFIDSQSVWISSAVSRAAQAGKMSMERLLTQMGTKIFLMWA